MSPFGACTLHVDSERVSTCDARQQSLPWPQALGRYGGLGDRQNETCGGMESDDLVLGEAMIECCWETEGI